jgi:hypothetical protein
LKYQAKLFFTGKKYAWVTKLDQAQINPVERDEAHIKS